MQNTEQNNTEKKKQKLPEHDHNGHRQRLRARFLREGLENFETHNILELLLFYSIPRKDTNDIAHALLKECGGSLAGVLEASPEKLMSVPGISENSAALIKMLLPIFRLYMTDVKKHGKTVGRESIIHHICSKFRGETAERVMLVSLNNRMELISCDVVGEGSVNFSMVDKRRVVELVLRHNATAAIIAHNHPEGYPEPSREDIETTMDIKKLLAGINVQLLDHIICSKDSYTSMQQNERFCALFV